MKFILLIIISFIFLNIKSLRRSQSPNLIRLDINQNKLTINKTLLKNDSIIINTTITIATIKTIDKKIDNLNKLIENYEKLNNITIRKTLNKTNVNNRTFIQSSRIDDIRNDYIPISIFDEMERNQDQRKNANILKFFLITSFVLNIFMFFTWRLSRKFSKYPSSLLFRITTCYLILVIVLLIIQISKNDNFEKIGLITILVINYQTSILNIIYFFSCLRIIKNSQDGLLLAIRFDKSIFYLNLFMSVLFLGLLFSNFEIKFCFVGSCFINPSNKLYMQIFPNIIESSILILCFIYHLYNFLNKQLNNDLKMIVAYELIYFCYNTLDTFIRYMKMKNRNYRYDDYCSIHDYCIIIKSFIFFIFFGLSSQNLSEWIKAFTDDKDDNMVKDEINEISQIKNRLKLNRTII